MRSGALTLLLAVQVGQPVHLAAAAGLSAVPQIADQFRRGEQAWRASCPKPTEDGSCVELRGGAHRPRLFALDRDPALVAEARRRFLIVAKLWRRLGAGEIPAAAESAHQAVAGAAFYLAEAQWEAFLRTEPPPDPRLAPHRPEADLIAGEEARPLSRQTRRDLEAFVTRKLAQLARTRRMYLAVVAMGESPFDAAAVARIGQLYEGFDDDTPGDLFDDKAVAAFQKCFEMETKTARYDEWFRLCEHELTVLRPFDFPKANELVPEASAAAPGRVVPVPVIPRLD